MGESCRVARLHDGRNLSPAGDLRADLAGERGKQNAVAEVARGHELTGAVSTGAVPDVYKRQTQDALRVSSRRTARQF